MNKVQKEQFLMLKKFDEICRKHNIKYFILGGTLLGAVRNKGFIPWDDDIDVGLLREDYDKFLEIAQEEYGDKYFVQNMNTEPKYGLLFTKIIHNNSVFLESAVQNVDIHHGIFMDVFVLENSSNDESFANKLYKKILIYRMLLLAKSKYIIEADTLFKKIEKIGLKIISLFLSKKYLVNKLDRLTQSIDDSTTEYVADYSTPYFTKWRMPRKFYMENDWYEFEGENFSGVKDYDAYLKFLYNDYMTLPPEDKRENRHGIIKVEINGKKVD